MALVAASRPCSDVPVFLQLRVHQQKRRQTKIRSSPDRRKTRTGASIGNRWLVHERTSFSRERRLFVRTKGPALRSEGEFVTVLDPVDRDLEPRGAGGDCRERGLPLRSPHGGSPLLGSDGMVASTMDLTETSP